MPHPVQLRVHLTGRTGHTWGLTWHERGRIVEQKTGPSFAAALNVPYSNQSDIFEINLLAGLGEQGWELVAVPKGTMYVFKRPR